MHLLAGQVKISPQCIGHRCSDLHRPISAQDKCISTTKQKRPHMRALLSSCHICIDLVTYNFQEHLRSLTSPGSSPSHTPKPYLIHTNLLPVPGTESPPAPAHASTPAHFPANYAHAASPPPPPSTASSASPAQSAARKCSASRATSSIRSRSAGTSIGNTASRW